MRCSTYNGGSPYGPSLLSISVREPPAWATCIPPALPPTARRRGIEPCVFVVTWPAGGASLHGTDDAIIILRGVNVHVSPVKLDRIRSTLPRRPVLGGGVAVRGGQF